MTLITITTNVECDDAKKAQLSEAVNSETAAVARTPVSHIHIHIHSSQFLSFGGDFQRPCATVTIKCATQQFREGARKTLVDKLVPLLQLHLGCSLDRTTTFFHEVPVENIAVGTQIMVFSNS